MLLYKTRKVRGIFNGLLLDLPNEVRTKAAQPPELVRKRPFHAARCISIPKLLQGSVVLLKLTCSQRRVGDVTRT
jgi:hypothetical protein